MRCTQPMGFGNINPINQEELDNLYPKVYSYDGMFNEYPLHEYIFNETPVYKEVVQYSPWSSGPMLYLAFKRVSDGVLFSHWGNEAPEEYYWQTRKT